MRWLVLKTNQHHIITKRRALSVTALVLIFLTVGCNGGTASTNSLGANETYSAEAWRTAIEEISIGMSRAEFNRAVERFRASLPPILKKVMRHNPPLPPQHVLTVLEADSSTTVIMRVQLVPDTNDYFAVFSDDSLQQLSADPQDEMGSATQRAWLPVLDGDISAIHTLVQEISSSSSKLFLRTSWIAALDADVEREESEGEAAMSDRDPLIVFLLFITNDRGDNIKDARRSAALIKKYDTSDIVLGSPPSILNERFGKPHDVIETVSGEVRIYGENASTGWYLNPRVVVLIEDDRIVATFTYYL